MAFSYPTVLVLPEVWASSRPSPWRGRTCLAKASLPDSANPSSIDLLFGVTKCPRNMQNYMLLDEVGRTNKPVVLKRGMSATIEEWLLAAEYILSQGNSNVILCERGVRTFEKFTRNTMDVSAIPVIKQLSNLPIISD